jgi:murein tripeptide amidase MpaA
VHFHQVALHFPDGFAQVAIRSETQRGDLEESFMFQAEKLWKNRDLL